MALSQSRVYTNTIFHDLECLNRTEKFELTKKIWPNSGLTYGDFQEEDYAMLLEYVRQELASLQRQPSKFAAETLDSTIELIGVLKKHRDLPRGDLFAIIGQRFVNVDESAIWRSIELAIRLWLTLNIRSDAVALGPIYAGTSSIEWSSTYSLSEVVKSQFQNPKRSKTSFNTSVVDPLFTAANLADVCSIQINWTSNLADHLDFNRTKRVLTVYQHKICLLNHSKSTEPHVIPIAIVEEAIDTLNLLFPFGDLHTRDFLTKHNNKAFYSLGFCDRDRVLDLSAYPIWGAKLADLVDTFNQPPRDLRQLLRDRRNMMEWATFWIAVLVILLTLVSIAFGTVSTVYSIKQYNLSVAQACLDPRAAIHLKKFCD